MSDQEMETDSKNHHGDDIDAKGILGRFMPSVPNVPPSVFHGSPDSDSYDMKHLKRGKCIIFNNKEFEPQTNLNVRKGTEMDAAGLYHCFRALGFDVDVHHNLVKKNMMKTLDAASREDHSSRDCFVCCVLTHGDQGILFAADGKFPTDDVFAPFRGDKCPTLVGKPKLFFIQACQGDRLDKGVMLSHDSGTICKIPTHADFLVAFSTVPGFYSWRNTMQGSWFIQALCGVLEKYGELMDLMSMMTIVNRNVAYDFESCTPNDDSMNMMKQVPCITSTLTRKVYFTPK